MNNNYIFRIRGRQLTKFHLQNHILEKSTCLMILLFSTTIVSLIHERPNTMLIMNVTGAQNSRKYALQKLKWKWNNGIWFLRKIHANNNNKISVNDFKTTLNEERNVQKQFSLYLSQLEASITYALFFLFFCLSFVPFHWSASNLNIFNIFFYIFK